MGYNYLDRYDIKLIEDNMTCLEDLLPVIDNLIGVAIDLGRQEAFEEGYDTGFIDGYDECYYTNEQAKNEKQQIKYDPLMDREYNI